MSLLSRVAALFRRGAREEPEPSLDEPDTRQDPGPAAERSLGPEPGPAQQQAVLAQGSSSDEAALHILLGRLDRLRGRGEKERPGQEISAALLSIDRLLQLGRAHRALEWTGRLATAIEEATGQPDPDFLLRLGRILWERRAPDRAVPVLERLLRAQAPPGIAVQAHDLLSQALQARADVAGARRHLAAILAEDIDYPQARARIDRLRLLDPSAPGRPPAHAGWSDISGLPGPQAGLAGALPTVAAGPGQGALQRYHLLRELGRGSAGTVYLAHDIQIGRDLAVKIFHPATGSDRGQNATRAWNEARLTAAVRHPGVVAIYDLDEERHLVVMELCTGGTLRQRLQSGRLPAQAALLRARELLDTLAVVHRTGVVHGDLKPGNLLFRGPVQAQPALADPEDKYGDLVIADFGIARLVGEAGQAAGTLGYVAPERVRGAPLSPAADLYAVGAIVLEMLLGALPASRWELLRGAPLQTAVTGPAAVELGPQQAAVEALLAALLQPDAAARPDALAALDYLGTVILRAQSAL